MSERRSVVVEVVVGELVVFAFRVAKELVYVCCWCYRYAILSKEAGK